MEPHTIFSSYTPNMDNTYVVGDMDSSLMHTDTDTNILSFRNGKHYNSLSLDDVIGKKFESFDAATLFYRI